MTPFAAWLFQQSERDDPVGDLARDAKEDPWFQRAHSIKAVEDYIETNGPAAQLALRRAIREWAAEVAE